MGCNSTKKENKNYSYSLPNEQSENHQAKSSYYGNSQAPQNSRANNNNHNNYNSSNNQNHNQQGNNYNHQVSLRDYPLGKAILLRKIQGTVKSLDNLKQLVELFVSFTTIPSPGVYTCELTVLEEGRDPKKIATFNPQNSDNNGQVVFLNSVEMNYYFEKDQKLQMKITEMNSGSSTTIVESIGLIASYSKKGCIVKDTNTPLVAELKMQSIKSEKKHYNFTISIDDTELNLAGKSLYLVIKNFNDNKTWRGVYKTEESTNPIFDSFTIAEDDLFLGDCLRNFRIELYSHSIPYLIAYSEVNISMISDEKACNLISPQNNQPLSSKLKFDLVVQEKFSFLELLNKGLQISMVVGVDFTASNGDVSNPSSKHYFQGREPNQYERAIRSCGSILAYYDHDQKFPLLGFGGIPPNKSSAEFVFPLNFQADPNVGSIVEMVEVYKKSLSMATLSGPTLFAPMLNNLCNLVKNALGVYTVIMILTDGMINDMEETIDAIIECSLLPISIIIIGVGNSDFSSMEKLDGDDMPLADSKGRAVARDIVQFVPFNKYEKNTQLLAEEVLKELPGQVEQFYLQTQKI